MSNSNLSKLNRCDCGKLTSVMHNKSVCAVCDDLLFDIEIECDEVIETKESSTTKESTKEFSLFN